MSRGGGLSGNFLSGRLGAERSPFVSPPLSLVVKTPPGRTHPHKKNNKQTKEASSGQQTFGPDALGARTIGDSFEGLRRASVLDSGEVPCRPAAIEPQAILNSNLRTHVGSSYYPTTALPKNQRRLSSKGQYTSYSGSTNSPPEIGPPRSMQKPSTR
ncbi:MAG: hypothetical protein BJ554DRAFT_2585 [Olpidium bornovanus]|uniref:Uncharacterized protein n=1 Tax=Olpidium bornovanus TaxID=278681 RepID=A0A8H7ZQ89_9FUNG|nr:MAG: hypothetical protein BJ554DRAFT_2585 [Olpidium bornovanus]